MRKDDKVCLVALITTVVLMWVVFLIATACSDQKIKVKWQGESKVQAGSELVIISTDDPTAFTAPGPQEEPTKEPYKSLGIFKLTAYCACTYCCGKNDGITASGTQVVEGKTIGADTDLLPFGTAVVINGHEYIVEDCGGSVKGKHIDVYMESHDAAVKFGVQYAEVFIKDE